MRDHNLFDKVDLHLIRVLHTVLTERSVSRAALRLGMYQPAVSAALKRLRELAGDPLLVRSGAGMALVGSPATVAERLREYQALGIDTVIASGYPHLEEAYRVAELLLPELGIAKPAGPVRNSFGEARVFGGGGHGGNVRNQAAS